MGFTPSSCSLWLDLCSGLQDERQLLVIRTRNICFDSLFRV